MKVLTILKEIIRDEEMFDMRNPAIILCDKDLEAALNMRALHVTEIRYRPYLVPAVPATYVTIFHAGSESARHRNQVPYQLYLLLTSLYFMRALHVSEIRYRTNCTCYLRHYRYISSGLCTSQKLGTYRTYVTIFHAGSARHRN